MVNSSKNIVLPKALIKKGVAILPLEEWEQIKEFIEDREDAERFNQAVSDTENQDIISFKKIKEELKLP